MFHSLCVFCTFQVGCVKVPPLVVREGDRWGGLTPHSLGVFTRVPLGSQGPPSVSVDLAAALGEPPFPWAQPSWLLTARAGLLQGGSRGVAGLAPPPCPFQLGAVAAGGGQG